MESRMCLISKALFCSSREREADMDGTLGSRSHNILLFIAMQAAISLERLK